MGLNITYLRQEGVLAPAGLERCCQFTERNEDGEEIGQEGQPFNRQRCEGCALECETWPMHDGGMWHGCSPRMGSYSYVASLPEFYLAQVAGDQRNRFMQLIRGGGFDELPANQVAGVLEDLRRAREVLRGMEIQAALTYCGEERVGFHAAATERINSIGGYHWHYGSRELSIGVHAGHGIAKIRPAKREEIFSAVRGVMGPAMVAEYVQESTDPEVLAAFRSWEKDAKQPDRVVMGTVPALEQFDHLFDTFERVAVLAQKYGLGMLGC